MRFLYSYSRRCLRRFAKGAGDRKEGHGSGGRVPQIAARCYICMQKMVERWLLFKYINGEFTPLSKPLKKKGQAEKARLKYSERERKTIGIGVIRTKG